MNNRYIHCIPIQIHNKAFWTDNKLIKTKSHFVVNFLRNFGLSKLTKQKNKFKQLTHNKMKTNKLNLSKKTVSNLSNGNARKFFGLNDTNSSLLPGQTTSLGIFGL